jgi:hypothetical protein
MLEELSKTANPPQYEYLASVPSVEPSTSEIRSRNANQYIMLHTVLQRREGEANLWEKRATLGNVLFRQTHIDLQCTAVLFIQRVRMVKQCIFIYCVLIPFF